MAHFYQTGAGPGGNNDTLGESTWNSGTFTTLWRAKNKKHRVRIAAIAKAIVEGPAVKYSQPKRSELFNVFTSGNYNKNLKTAKSNKIKGKHCDCSSFASTCCKAAGASIGLQTSRDIVDANYSKFKKYKAQSQFAAGKQQKGDIVAYRGHAAVVSRNGGNVKKGIFDDFFSDGTQKIKNKKTEEIIKKYTKKYKSKVRQHDDTIKELNAYIKKLKSQKKIIENKIKKNKAKTQTKAIKDYLKKLRKTKKKLKDAIDYAEDRLKKLNKNAKNKNKTKPKTSSSTSSSTAENDTEKYALDGEDIDPVDSDDEEDSEPKPSPEVVNYYFVRSGPSYFSQGINNILHKDYLGKTYCKRKLKIKTIITTASLWDFTFDMTFAECTGSSANITNVKKIDSNHWQVYFKKNNDGQIAAEGSYTFKLKTSVGIEYEIRCEIETHYDD